MFTPFSKPLYVMAKAIGAHCNLACKYCYYLDKSELYPEQSQHVMSDETLELFIRQYIEAQSTPNVLFTWHGGETFLRPLSFYQKALALQRQYANGRNIDNCIQTNGTLITPEWAKFLHDNNWLVGVSIDGPQEFHDEYRRNKAGRPSWAKVMHGIDLLNKYGVEWNAMAVVNDFNADYPLDFYRFFRDELGAKYLQFTPIVEAPLPTAPPSNGRGLQDVSIINAARGQEAPLPFGGEAGVRGAVSPESVTPEQWGTFLCAIFDEWVRRDVGEQFVQLFDATLANWMGVAPGVCSMARDCGHAGVIEWNGDVYSCDHFVFPQHKLGNIHQHSIYELMNSPQQQEFAKLKQGSLTDDCRQCQWLFACNGECPKNRILPDGRNYLCSGYRQFFEHVAPYMDFMKAELQAGRDVSAVMSFAKTQM